MSDLGAMAAEAEELFQADTEAQSMALNIVEAEGSVERAMQVALEQFCGSTGRQDSKFWWRVMATLPRAVYFDDQMEWRLRPRRAAAAKVMP